MAGDEASEREGGLGLGVFLALAALAAALLALASWLEGSAAWRNPLHWLSTLDSSAALAVLAGAAQIVAGVLAILITVVAIVLELAATRYTHRITQLFVRDPVNVAVMTFFVLTTVLCVWLAVALSGAVGEAPFVPRGGFMLAMGMMTVSLLMLLPYFVYVFHFVSPLAVIRRIRAVALARVRGARPGNVREAKARVIEAVEELEDVARSAMQHSDRGIAMAAVEALVDLLSDVTRLRGELPSDWFVVDDAIARDADFVSMAAPAIDEVAREGSWFESKILRQCLALFGDAVGNARDVASMIAIHTRRVAESYALAHPPLVEQCQRAFHSYLRAAINARDPRTAYYVLHQYRLLGEALLAAGLEPAALEVASRIRYYGRLASASELPFLLEVAAYDLAHMVESAGDKATARDALLEVLLAIDHEGAENLLGVRRAQIQLGTYFLARGELAPARRIAADLVGERRGLMLTAREELEREVSPNYWEITDRGSNFAYLPPERRAKLAAFFALVAEAAPKPAREA
ncbi:MAG TPA: DUF2254 family protein [Myxococcota bacterium]